MKIRADSILISSALFTFALLCLVPGFWTNVLTSRDKVWLAKYDADYRVAMRTMSDLSVVCLAVILVALIVVWSGYIKRERWTWFVMFVMVWVWAFPLLALRPFEALFSRTDLTFAEWLLMAIYQPGPAGAGPRSFMIFLLMAIALLLPIRSFFFIKERHEPSHKPSPKLMALCAVSILAIMLALLTWIRIGVLYEIKLEDWSQQLPPPPPPPTWDRSQ